MERIRLLKTAAAVAGMIMCVAAAAADEYSTPVENIQVRGLNRVTRGAVLLALPFKPGDMLTRDSVAQAMKQLYATGDFDKVSLSKNGSTVTVDVTERPTIAGVEFKGNSNIKDDDLKPVIEQQGLKEGEPLNVQTLAQVTKSLEDFYHGAGMYQAKIEPVITTLPRNRVNVKLQFTEGVAAEIKQINIVGNKAFPEDVLLAQMQLRDNVPWWNFVADQRYDAQKFRADLDSLRNYYMNHGYVKFKIENTNVEMTPDRKGLYLTIEIKEGDQYKVGKTTLAGDTLTYGADIKKLLTLEEGNTYSQQDVTDNEKMIKDFLGKYGYANTEVNAVPTFNEDKKTVDLAFNVVPGSRVYVSQIFISGNDSTDDTVIRREMRQMDGTWLSNEAMETSKTRLNRTGFFEKVDMETQRNATTPDTVNVQTKVKERPTGSIQGGIGFGTDSGLLLSASISQNNLFGWGTRGVLSSYRNDYRRHTEISYTDPYFTVDNISLGGRIYYDSYYGDDDDVVDYDNRTYGFEINSGYPISENWSVSYAVGLERMRIRNRGRHFQQADVFWAKYGDADDRSGNFLNYTASVSLTHNSLDKGVFPTEGNKQVFTAMAAVPGSDTKYYKLTAETYHYFPFDTDHQWIASVRGRVGYGDGYGKKNGHDQILPFFKNFYLGSTSWLRGFDHNSIGPKAIYYSDDTNLTGPYISDTAVGGNAFWAASAEFFVPTPLVPEAYKDQVRTSIFYDAGALWDTHGSDYYYDFSDAGKFRASVGVAVTWISPVGPLSFSLTKAVKKYDGDDTQVFNFNIGGSF
jgi:outer membrane protein insertion porin family